MKKKTIALLLVLMLVFGVTCGGTIAYLTSTTGTIENTFTVGKVGITMFETKVNAYGVEVNAEGQTSAEFDALDTKPEGVPEWKVATTTAGNKYKLIPGHTYVKDPTITVDSDSEKAWLFVKLENGLEKIEKAGENTIAKQMEAKWTLLGDGVYYYNDQVKANDKITVFSSFTLDDGANVSQYTEENMPVIKITAYAVQADGMANAADAWRKAPSSWN